MITYKEFIDKMIEKGYVYNDHNPIAISNDNNNSNNNNDIVSTFSVCKGKIGKIIEMTCPDNYVVALCGTEHEGGCRNDYVCNLKCCDNYDNEPFQGLHYSTELTKGKHVVAEIIVTKILRNDPPTQYKKVREWSETIAPILKLIGSNNNREHVMWIGTYNKFSDEFNKTSFTLYGGQKMTFYIHNPDIDITKIDFKFNVDIFEHDDNKTFSGQY